MKLKKIKPLYTTIITTADRYEETKKHNGIIDIKQKEGDLKEFQRVVEVGSTVRDVKVGDLVHINYMNYAKIQQRKNSVVEEMEEYHREITGFNIPAIILGDKEHLFLQERDVDYIVEDYEE